jgi:predicted AlkP superfamily pyrophosphatase or phosphodiesterase
MRAILLGLALFTAIPTKAEIKRPKLILVVVFDQFRADYLTRFEKKFGPGGFRYLMENGAYYPNGEYDIAQSMTCPGHATILTGAYPYLNGIVSNTWFDREKKLFAYCAEDESYSIVGAATQPHTGTSPKNMNSTTVGDELKNAGFPSKVVTVALKDRAAIMMGGHRPDLAFWFDNKTHQWVTSSYYLPEKNLPAWMNDLNQEVKKTEGQEISWGDASKSEMIYDESQSGAKLSNTVKTGSRDSYAMAYGAELTEQASERAFDAYQLGHSASTDLMAISFSGHDYAGHAFGPNSKEMEILTLAEDRQLAKFLSFVKKKIPLDQITIVLTADHGIPPNPDWLTANRVDAGRISDDKEYASLVSKALDERFGKPKSDWFGYVHDFNFYFNPTALAERSAALHDVEAITKSILEKQKGVAFVYTSQDYADRKLPPGMHGRQIMNTFYLGRSADVTFIPKPFYMPTTGDTVDHLTGYSYDRTVPIIFAGFGVKPGIYSNSARVIDIAPTLTFLSGVVAPSLSEGRVLSEAINLKR